MNLAKYNSVNLEEIGMDCYYQALSSCFSYMDIGHLRFLYNDYSFLYKDITSFISLDLTLEPEQYLLKPAQVAFNMYPKSFIRDAYRAYADVGLLSHNVYSHIKSLFPNCISRESLSEFKNRYFDKNLPIIVMIKLFNLKDFYISLCGRGCHAPGLNHLISIIDYSNGFCSFIDNDFRLRTEINDGMLIQAYLDSSSKKVLTFDHNVLSLQKDLDYLMRKNFEHTLTQFTFKGVKFDNQSGMDLFIADFPEILTELAHRYGEYWYPFYALLTRYHRKNRHSFSTLLNEYKENLDSNLKTLADLANETSRLWKISDAVCEKNYFKRGKVNEIEDIVVQILMKISENDKIAHNCMEIYVRKN